MPSLPTYEKDVLDAAKKAPDRGGFDPDALPDGAPDPLEDRRIFELLGFD